jgi:TP901-1 family phage major tail protein
MAAQAGKAILIKVDTNGAGTFGTIGGMRSKSIALNKETVDVTDSDSVGQWRELLSGAGVKTCSISGSGVFKDSANEGIIRTNYLTDVIAEYQFIIPDFGTFEGPFDVTSIEYSGEYNGEAQYSMSFESAGQLTFTAA